jgi:hypothetical protein
MSALLYNQASLLKIGKVAAARLALARKLK